MLKSRYLKPIVLVLLWLAPFGLAGLLGCRIVEPQWGGDGDSEIASGPANPAWEAELQTAQTALAEARALDPSIAWVAGDNPILRGFTTKQMKNLAGDEGLTEIPQGLMDMVPPGMIQVVEVATGQTPFPDELFSPRAARGGSSVRNGPFRRMSGGDTGMPESSRRASYSLPPSISWKNREGIDWLTSIRNQGSYNTCSVFAALGALESYLKIARGDPAWTIDLSEAWSWRYGTAWFNTSSGNIPLPRTVSAWKTGLACTFLLPPFGGIPEETVAPYPTFIENYQLFNGIGNPAVKFRANALFAIKGAAALKLALQKGPVVGSMEVDKFFQSYDQGIYSKIATPANTVVGNHAILFVGYDDQQNYWECKNSWGPGWGEDGYFRIRQNDPQIAVNRTAYLISVPVAIVGRTPLPDSVVATDAIVLIEIGERLKESSITSGTVMVVDAETRQPVEGALSLDNDGRRITFRPAQPLQAARTFVCTVTTGVRSLDDDSIEKDETWSFATAGAEELPPVAILLSKPSELSGETTTTFQTGGTGIVAVRYKLDQGAWGPEVPATAPIVLEGLAEGEHTLQVIGRNAAGAWQAEGSPTGWTWTVVTQVGRVTILQAPPPVTVSPEFEIIWMGEKGVAATKVRLDAIPIWSSEILPDENGIFRSADNTKLQNGTHTYRIIARNAAGVWQPAASATVHTWYVNIALGTQVTLTGLPPLKTRATRATITVGGKDVEEYNYALDKPVFGLLASVSVPIVLSGLSVGTHTLRVSFRDTLGMIQPTQCASSYTWTVLPPLVVLDSGPEAISATSTAMFVASGEEIIEVRHQLDGGVFGDPVPATQPIVLQGLSEGPHTFRIIGRNAAGAWQAEAQAASWTWTVSTIVFNQQWGTSEWDQPEDSAADPAGNVFLTGFTWGNLEGNTGPGGGDAFLTKVATDGSRVWTKQFGSQFKDDAHGVALAPDGDIVVTGVTNGTLPGQTPGGDYDLWLARFAPDGTLRWLRQYGDATAEEGWEVAVDPTGTIHVVGRSFEVSGQVGLLLMRFDPAGEQIFRQTFAVSLITEAKGLAVDPQGNSIVTAAITSTFNAQIPQGANDCLVMKVLADGSIAWTRFLGTPADDFGRAVAIDPAGDVYVTGTTAGTFDGQAQAGMTDAFLAKFDSAGNRLWVSQFGSVGDDAGTDVCLAPNGAPTVAGTANGTLNGVSGPGNQDLFAISFSPLGTLQWTGVHGTAGTDSFPTLVADGLQPFTLAGATQGALPGFTNLGGYDLWLIRMDGQGAGR